MLDLMGAGVARAEARLASLTNAGFVEDLRSSLKVYVERAQDVPALVQPEVSLTFKA